MSLIRGRFHKAADKLAAEYTASSSVDWRLYPYDIKGSIAHVRMLAKQKIISEKEAEMITEGLASIREEMEQGKFQFRVEQEDIHMSIEARLIEKIGEVGRKLHTARSRNDQVALDLRLFTKEAISETITRLRKLQQALVNLAERNKDVTLPGYTHLQPAQPVLLAHHLLAYFEMLSRDAGRFSDCRRRADVMPLGSGAVAGVAYNIDRDFLASELGFSRLSQNSIDAVSDRDFVVEYEAAASLCMMHLSRLAEEVILWSSAEFGFIELDDAYATSSSIMPQKKNPDVVELARGKTGRVYGRLMAMLAMMKALPLSYDRDLQEDKEGLFDTVDTLLSTLEVITGVIKTVKLNTENMERAAGRDYILATDLADYLVSRGEAFRSAHNIVARLVSYAIDRGKSFRELSLDEYQGFSPRFGQDVYSITVASSVAARDVIGGTAPSQVARALSRAKKLLGEVEGEGWS
ncbi:MAG: argininosuccinate lyase [Dehalococcoidales bacterium]|nr:argininosuccinate lyase [Dehalococcoidales bacterium]